MLQTTVGNSIFNTESTEFFINMKPGDIPPPKHPDRIAFLLNEQKKCQEGVIINGTAIPPTLYYDLNFHTIELDDENETEERTARLTTKPSLRDNGWLFHNEYWEAQKTRQMYVIGGARQVGKSDLIVSLTCRELFCYDKAEAMGLFSISQDKQTFNKKLQVALADKTNPLRIPSIDKDLDSTEVRFGLTQKNNDPIILSRLYTYLTKAGKATEVGAGKSLTFFFFDEIAKEEMRSAWGAVKPALRGSSGRYRTAPLMAFTGGNVEKSADAINLFMNPEANQILPFENEGKLTGRFIGGWYRSDFKKWQSLTSYLKLPEEGYLSTIQIKVADFELANEVLDREELLARNNRDPNELAQHKMYNPRTLDEMALSAVDSPFKQFREGLKAHRDWLRSNTVGIPIDFFRTPDGVVHQQAVNKLPISNFPHKDTDDLDAPIIIYDAARYEYSYKLHVGGLDPYNVGVTETSASLGAFYLMRRTTGNLSDPFAQSMVLSYVARPDRIPEFLKKIKMILDYFHGSMLHEATNDLVLDFFDKNHEAEKYLGKSQNLRQEIAPNSQVKSSYGVPATPAYQRAWMGRLIDYLQEVIGVTDTGEPIYGYTRILDPMLCEEMIQHKAGMNVDRIVAFGHALLYMDNLDKYEPPRVGNAPVKDVIIQPRARYGLGGKQTGLKNNQKKPYGF